MTPSRAVTHARSMAFSSCRTFPGQGYFSSTSIASGLTSGGCCPGRAYFWQKCAASSGMSSGRSRSGGRSIRTTLSR